MPFVNNFIGINALQWKTDSTSLAQPEKDLLLEPSSYLVADTMTWDSLASAETFDQYLADLFHVFENITQWTDIRKAQSMQASARCLQTQQDAQYKAVAEAERDKALRADQARREEEARNTQHWIDRVMGRKPVVSRSSPWFTPW